MCIVSILRAKYQSQIIEDILSGPFTLVDLTLLLEISSNCQKIKIELLSLIII